MFSKIRQIEELMLTVTDSVFHYEAMDKPDQYIVYAEDREGSSVEGDDQKINQSIQGTIDYFTKKDWDENVNKIQGVLKDNCISFYLNSVQFEEETGYQHYEWVWEVG